MELLTEWKLHGSKLTYLIKMEYDFAFKEYITIYKANNKIIIGTLVIFNEQRSAYY
jgi:hypothetical protein